METVLTPQRIGPLIGTIYIKHRELTPLLASAFSRRLAAEGFTPGYLEDVTDAYAAGYGRLLADDVIRNVVTNAGKPLVAGLINGATANNFKWIAIGTGSTAAAAADTALVTETTTLGGARMLGTVLDRITTTLANDTARTQGTFTFSGSVAVNEAGLFDQLAVGGNMLARQIIGVYNVVNTNTLQVTWQMQVT